MPFVNQHLLKKKRRIRFNTYREIKLRKPQGPVRKKKLLIRLIPRKIRRQNRSLSKLRMMVLWPPTGITSTITMGRSLMMLFLVRSSFYETHLISFKKQISSPVSRMAMWLNELGNTTFIWQMPAIQLMCARLKKLPSRKKEGSSRSKERKVWERLAPLANLLNCEILANQVKPWRKARLLKVSPQELVLAKVATRRMMAMSLVLGMWFQIQVMALLFHTEAIIITFQRVPYQLESWRLLCPSYMVSLGKMKKKS